MEVYLTPTMIKLFSLTIFTLGFIALFVFTSGTRMKSFFGLVLTAWLNFYTDILKEEERKIKWKDGHLDEVDRLANLRKIEKEVENEQIDEKFGMDLTGIEY